jgi:hypothetical protein
LENDPDLVYLRSIAGENPTKEGWVEGRAVQNLEPDGVAERQMAVPDATVTLSAGAMQRSTAVGQEGTSRRGRSHWA